MKIHYKRDKNGVCTVTFKAGRGKTEGVDLKDALLASIKNKRVFSPGAVIEELGKLGYGTDAPNAAPKKRERKTP